MVLFQKKKSKKIFYSRGRKIEISKTNKTCFGSSFKDRSLFFYKEFLFDLVFLFLLRPWDFCLYISPKTNNFIDMLVRTRRRKDRNFVRQKNVWRKIETTWIMSAFFLFVLFCVSCIIYKSCWWLLFRRGLFLLSRPYKNLGDRWLSNLRNFAKKQRLNFLRERKKKQNLKRKKP